MIDSHCHLADETFSADLEAVVARARDAGVERALVILEAGNTQEADQAVRLHAMWPEVRAAVGVHPHAAQAYSAHPLKAAETVREQVVRTPFVRAVGEIGLDYHYNYSEPSVQQSVFRAQVDLARELGLPIVVHTREADADTLRILRDEGRGAVAGVLHCFTGNADLARAGLDLGLYISLAGIITFNRAAELRETARLVPLDRVLIETDSPFLAPIPHRGKRNEPAFVPLVAAALAELHHVDVQEIARRTSANFHSLFRP